MQGRSDPQRELLDVEAVAGHLLPSGGVFGFLAAHRDEVFPDAMILDLFPSGRGRPSVPAPVVATVLVLQALHGLSDREAVEAVTFDLRWKAACGLAVSASAFHPTTLTYWRARLARSQRPDRVFEAVREVVAATGARRSKTRRALDCTVLDDAVATQDTVTQLVAAVRRVARVLPGGAELVAAAGTRSGHDYSRPGKPEIAWDDTVARAHLIDGLVRDARAVLAAVAAAEDAGGLVLQGAGAEAVGLLGLVAGQDVELVPDPGNPGGAGTWRIAQRVAADRVISTVDPQARHAHKTSSRRQDGFEAHVVVEPDTGIITACGTGDMLAALQGAGHVPLVKPWPVNPAVPGGFTVDDFTVDADANTLTCPAGITRPINQGRQVNFGVACRACPLRARCTRSATGKSMRIREHDALQRAHRARAADPGFRALYRQHRPMVERSLAWLTRGNRKLRYIGTTKNNAWLHLRASAVNLRRLTALGLDRDHDTWVLTG